MDGEEVESVGEIRPSARYMHREMRLHVDIEMPGGTLGGIAALETREPPQPLLLDDLHMFMQEKKTHACCKLQWPYHTSRTCNGASGYVGS